MAVEIQKTLCGGRNTDNLIESTCFYLKISGVHVFCSKFSQVRMFCNDDRSKLVPGFTRNGFSQVERLSITCTKKSKVKFNNRTKGRMYVTLRVHLFYGMLVRQ